MLVINIYDFICVTFNAHFFNVHMHRLYNINNFTKISKNIENIR